MPIRLPPASDRPSRPGRPGERGPQQLREAIEEEIATGRLPPGVRLDETELAARFGVSRTPVREALRLLVGEGLLENRRHRGSVVAQLTPHRLVEMFEVMAELEAMCARLAARRMTDGELATLQASHDACRVAARARDSDAYFYANEEFHFAIYAGSHNTFLAEQAAGLQRKLRPYRRLQLRVRDRLRRSFEEHQGIVDALRAGDGTAAADRLRHHVVVQNERFADLMASLTGLAGEATTPPPAPPMPAKRAARRGSAAGASAKTADATARARRPAQSTPALKSRTRSPD